MLYSQTFITLLNHTMLKLSKILVALCMFFVCNNKLLASDNLILGNDSTTERDLLELYCEEMKPLQLNVSLAHDSIGTDFQPYKLSPSMMDSRYSAKGVVPSIYSLPYSFTGSAKDWHRLWINTAVFSGAFVGTLLVLECLPEDATSWNRAEIRNVPLFKRWYDHVFVKGPEWDHDKFYFNYILHPYAGAVYFMAARSCGFNFWQSLLYSSLISNVGWEFGIEAFTERPSYQDMIITPIVGSAIGEGFYRLKRHLVENDYHLFGSPVVGNIVAFLIDPVNEVVGLFDHNPARAEARRLKEERGEGLSFTPVVAPGYGGFSLVATF